MKKVLSLILSVCLLFSVFAYNVSAADVYVDDTLPAIVKFCPGTIIGKNTDEVLPPPQVFGSTISEGWEIKVGDSEFIPYDGEPLELEDDGAVIRYFAATVEGDSVSYDYSNECQLIVKHNPTGEYLYSGSYHWRVCADCGDKADEEIHSFLIEVTGSGTACKVCGAHRTTQWTGLASFFDWLFNEVLVGLLPLFGL